MECYVKLLIIFLSLISTAIDYIKCEDIANGTLKENTISSDKDKNQATKLVSQIPVVHITDRPHLKVTKINHESFKQDQLSPALKKSLNENIESIENESGDYKKVPLPIIWYKQLTPNEINSDIITNPIDSNEVTFYNDLSLLHRLNYIRPMISLPEVYPMYFNRMKPNQKLINYDSYGLNSEDLLMSRERVVTTSEEELLAQLSHDAVMQNILPTMPFPYFRRTSIPSVHEVPHAQFQDAHTIAMCPNGKITDCAVPLLLTCSVKLTQGILSESPSYGNIFDLEPIAHEIYQTDEHGHSGTKEVTTSLNIGHVTGNENMNEKKNLP